MTAICKKFGKFPESLCQIYICQVLEGLLYLHDQGVIHRDIKGSNILATKEGSVKLADFGVATRVGGIDRSVVGSPYWMAPEVVEQSGATTASDIWSVGCVVIELLEGQPPYHGLEPMPALFRIVNDDCPPLPDSASPVVRDFLLQCFQKDSNLRISARKLLRHPWMVSARRQLDQMKRPAGASPRPISTYDETVQRVQEWNKALDNKPKPVSMSAMRSSATRLSEDIASALQDHSKAGSFIARSTHNRRDSSISDRRSAIQSSPVQVRLKLNADPALAPLVEEDEDKENDNWDNDFEEGIPQAKIAALDGSPAAVEAEDNAFDEAFDNSDTIRPLSKTALGLTTAKKTDEIENYSDLALDKQKGKFERRVADLQVSPP